MGAITGINMELRTQISQLLCKISKIHVRILHANFQASSFAGVGEE